MIVKKKRALDIGPALYKGMLHFVIYFFLNFSLILFQYANLPCFFIKPVLELFYIQ